MSGIMQTLMAGDTYQPGSQAYTTAGSFSFTVPGGVYNLTSGLIVGGGGGGGGQNSTGDSFRGNAGGSGGVYTGQTIAVTPGEVLTIEVGAGGTQGGHFFNSVQCTAFNGVYGNGNSGAQSRILRGATVLFVATGGAPVTAGTPSGVNGAAGGQMNDYVLGPGGNNGSGYGTGGNSNASGTVSAFSCPTAGGTGAVSFSW